MASAWWEPWIVALQPYAVLLRLFIDGAIDAPEFEILFLRLYKNDPADWPIELFDVLDAFFADVDEFCSDPVLGSQVAGTDADHLRERAQSAFERLQIVAGGLSP